MSRRTRTRPPSSPAAAAAAPPSDDHPSEPASSSSLLRDEVPFFNTTFSLHRISSLYIGASPDNSAGGLSPDRLQTLSARLRDTLVGDVVRGIEVGLGADANAALGGAGALEAVKFQMLPVEEFMSDGGGKDGLYLELQYENALSTALLLPSRRRDGEQEEDESGKFVHLPLLLLRMPAPLKVVVVEFLCTTFDCRVTNLKLGSRDLVQAWEGWIRDVGVPASGPLSKEAVLTLGFKAPPVEHGDEVEEQTSGLGIKTIDVIVPSKDLRRFVTAGETLEGAGAAAKPFTTALAKYVKHHLALDMDHPAVRIVRIACGGFVMSEGRLKIFVPDEREGSDSARREGIRAMMDGLVARAQGRSMAGVEVG